MHPPARTLAPALILFGLLVQGAAAGTLNKCIDVHGRVSYSEFPCQGSGTRQENVSIRSSGIETADDQKKRQAQQRQVDRDVKKRLEEQDREHAQRTKQAGKEANERKKKCDKYRELVEQYTNRMRAGASANTYNSYAGRKQELEERISKECS